MNSCATSSLISYQFSVNNEQLPYELSDHCPLSTVHCPLSPVWSFWGVRVVSYRKKQR